MLHRKKRNERKRRIGLVMCLLAGIFAWTAFWDAPFKARSPQKTEDSCGVYYLLNIDGMKGLGHTALLLTNEQGEGLIYSYNGMQYSLIECLLGKAGIGKMKVFTLSPEEVRKLLSTGDLQVEDTAECDNFDRVLYRYISRDDYEQIRMGAIKYIVAGTVFEHFYADFHNAEGEGRIAAKEKMNDLLNQKNVPKYQIYVHNCDTAARELMAVIDKEVGLYNSEKEKLTPTGNYLGMCNGFSEVWGYRIMGIDTLAERVFWR